MRRKAKERLKEVGGFTLIEVLTVVVILAIVSFMTVPSFLGWIRSYKTRSAASDIASNIKLTRAQAIKEGTRTYIMAFDASTDTYVFGYDTSDPLDFVPEGFDQGAPRTIALSDYNGAVTYGSDTTTVPSGSLAIASVPVNGIDLSPANIRFNAEGTVSNTGGVFIHDNVGNNYCINIDTMTGTVILWRWDGANWNQVF